MLIIWFALHADGAIHWKQSLALTNGLLLCAKNRIPQIGSATRTSQPQTMPPRRDSTHLSRVGESGQVALNVRRNRYVIIILFMIIIISVNFDYVHILSSAISERTSQPTRWVLWCDPCLHFIRLSLLVSFSANGTMMVIIYLYHHPVTAPHYDITKGSHKNRYSGIAS